jgi:plastocyanin
MKLPTLATLIAVVSLVCVSSSLSAAPQALVGTVGPGFTIKMNKQRVNAGSYTITIHDLAKIHDFHLYGPGVNKKTTVQGTGTTTWHVTLKKGTYTYVCDPHRAFMIGKLVVT